MPSAVRGVCHVVLLALLIPVVLVWGYDCVDQDITTVITLTPGGTHSLTRCHVHSGGQVVLTGGGTLTVVSSTVTAGWDHIPKIVVESVSTPLYFTLQDTALIAPVTNNSILVTDLLMAGSTVSITGNTFGNMSDVNFMGSTTLHPASSITIESNSVGNHAVSSGPGDYTFNIHNINMGGGSLRVVSNTGASLTAMPPPSGAGGDRYLLITIGNANLIAANAGIINVSYNRGFYPVAAIEINGDNIASSPPPHLSLVINNNEAFVGDPVESKYIIIKLEQTSNNQGNVTIEASGNSVRQMVGNYGYGCQLFYIREGRDFLRNFLTIRVLNNTLVARDQAAPYSSASDILMAIYQHEGERNTIPSNINVDVSYNTQDIQVSGRLDLAAVCVALFFGHMKDSSFTSSFNNVTLLGTGDISAFMAHSQLQTYDNSSLTVMYNDVHISSSAFITFLYADGTILFGNESTFVMSHNNFLVTNTSYSEAVSATYLKGTMNFTQNAMELFEISFNTISGECDSSAYGIFVNSSNVGGFASTTTAMGCHNTVCGTYIRNLDNSSSSDALQWEYCPDTTTTTATTTTTVTTTTTNTTAAPPSSVNKAITTFPDKPSSPTGLAAAGMVVSSIGASLDSASSVQIMAMMSVMACRTDGEDEGTARLFLTPLRIDDSLAAADLIGSIVLAVGISAVYLAIAGLVMLVVRSRGPKTRDPIPDDENGGTYDEDGAAYAREKRVFRAKLFLLYPNLPMLVLTLLFPGIVFDSSSLLYGALSLKATVGERVLGGVCLAASVGFCVHHVIAGVFSVRKVQQQDAVEDSAQSYELPPQQNDDASYSNPATPADSHPGRPAPDEGEEHQAENNTPTPTGSNAVVEVTKESGDDNNAAVDITADPRSRVWFILYTESDRGHHPRLLELLLLPDGRWNSVASRSWCGVITSLKGTAWGAGRCSSHGLVRMLLISIVAAINPSTATGCDVVQSLVAAVSFAHGALLLIARIYRIPVLNPLQGLQSILVGLLHRQCPGPIRLLHHPAHHRHPHLGTVTPGDVTRDSCSTKEEGVRQLKRTRNTPHSSCSMCFNELPS